jgi:ribosomal protein L16 Arg81 hydroxylase
MRIPSFAEILSPLGIDTFFSEYWGKNYLLQRGSPGRFSDLLPWSALNTALETQRVDHPRVRLAKDGVGLPASSIFEYRLSRRNIQVPRLKVSELQRQLREGSTLVIDAVDEMYLPLRAFAESVERTLGESIQVNAYAGWGETKGFDLHWDDHDVLIFQVAGKKAWKVFGQTRKYPLFRDKNLDFPAPTEVLWDGTLCEGDLLYIPRGWWHVATALSEPTLHLTFGLNNRTGIDWLHWISEQMVDYDCFRQDLPRFGSKEEQENHLKFLKDILAKHVADLDFGSFLRSRDALAYPRPNIGLPSTATEAILPRNHDYSVASQIPRDPVIQSDFETVSLSAMGKELVFSRQAEPLLVFLLSGGDIPIQQVLAKTELDAASVLDLVRQLVVEGILKIKLSG